MSKSTDRTMFLRVAGAVALLLSLAFSKYIFFPPALLPVGFVFDR